MYVLYAHMSACIFYYYYHYYYEDNIEEKEQSLKLVWKGSVSNFILLAHFGYCLERLHPSLKRCPISHPNHPVLINLILEGC